MTGGWPEGWLPGVPVTMFVGEVTPVGPYGCGGVVYELADGGEVAAPEVADAQ